MMSEPTYAQQYYAKNKNKLRDYVRGKTQCECGSIVSRTNLALHRRSKLHANKMNPPQGPDPELKECKCGSIVIKINYQRHLNSKLHANKMRHKLYLENMKENLET